VQLTLLEHHRDQGPLGLSFVLHVGAVTAAVLLPLFSPGVIDFPRPHYSVMTLIAPRPAPPVAPTRVDLPRPKPVPVKFETAVLTIPQRPAPQQVRAPKVGFDQAKAPALSSPQNSMPRLVPAVRTGVLTGSSAPPTVKAPVAKVQTGGFGDPFGAAPAKSSDRGTGRLVMAKLGSFDLPPGSGYGNGSGGARGIRGTVASAGFGSSIAGPGEGGGQGGHPRGGVRTAGFSDATVAAAPAPRAPAQAAAKLQPMEILYKPNPVYTEEARRLRLEGEVLLEVVFGASGELRVLRVVRGLGHGLDEAAVRSAQQIRFKPAKREGQAVDSVATLHVRFQLAY
jgi:TonB family protein